MPAPPVKCPPAVATVPAPPVPSEINELLAYQQSLRQLFLADLMKELDSLNLKPMTPRVALQKAMVLALTRGNGDLLRAQAYLDDVLNSSKPEALRLKPLARLLAANDAELQRLAEQLEKSTQQTRESQRRIDQLNGMLEGLKAIERTLPTRPNAVIPPTAK
jgi:paraquat-inducible protein B